MQKTCHLRQLPQELPIGGAAVNSFVKYFTACKSYYDWLQLDLLVWLKKNTIKKKKQ